MQVRGWALMGRAASFEFVDVVADFRLRRGWWPYLLSNDVDWERAEVIERWNESQADGKAETGTEETSRISEVR